MKGSNNNNNWGSVKRGSFNVIFTHQIHYVRRAGGDEGGQG